MRSLLWTLVGFLVLAISTQVFSRLSPDTDISFDTRYEVAFINAAGQEITRIFLLPDGINGIDIIGKDGTYGMYVIYDNLKREAMIQNAVIDVLSFTKLKSN